jgi:UDP-N-acetylmuramoylalanine--D-glutamate ligase
MIKLAPYSSAVIVGFGRVGRIVTQYLMHKKIFVHVYDDNQKLFTDPKNSVIIRNPFIKTMQFMKLTRKKEKPQFSIISPGFPKQNRIIQYLKNQHIPMIDEIEFTASLIKKPIISITGTNGKSTATVLLGKILEAADQNVFWGGNLAPGLPFATALYQEPKDIYIIEVSSFQLSRCHNFHPHIAVITNITADHLDRHITLSEYQKAKFRIFKAQNYHDYAIINREDKSSIKLKHTISSKIIYFSQKQKVNGAYLIHNKIYYKNATICTLNDIKLVGKHYLDSILAVITVAKLLNVSNRVIIKVLQKFTGLPHRLEFIRQHASVKYINNSMCTNPIAAAATLESFSQPVILIAGGKEKKLDTTTYIRSMIHKAKFIVLFGENKNSLSMALHKHHFNRFQKANTLQQAVLTAKQKALPNDIILFSPGFASLDKFRNFYERGIAFSKIVYGI